MLRRRPSSTIRQLLATEAAGGYILMLAAALAMMIASSPLSGAYFDGLHLDLGGLSLLHWINDGLMTLFFLNVGLEIKRELVDGEMSSWSRRLLPGAAAFGGMVMPALFYLAINRNQPANLAGWAIPAATDIAFALGVLALLGKRVPASLKLLLTAIAIIDDLGAILIIAVAYTDSLNMMALAAAAAGLAALVVVNRCRVRSLLPYLIIGSGVWFALLQSGIHATLAGVAVAFTIPLKASGSAPDGKAPPLLRLENALGPMTAFIIVPIFGFANAGIDLRGIGLGDAVAPVPLGVAFGLLIGKQLGVFGAIAISVRLRLADLPPGANWWQVWGLSLLCGIGFTMSLFIAALAFGEGSPMEAAAKLGIIGGSLVSALLGWLVLRRNS
ncbi:MAG: Na+/H+ antiporter NhaA [Polymorphobacter sp.]